MILIITNRQDQTADFLIVELKRRKIDYFRFNTEDFPKSISIHWLIRDGVISGFINSPKLKLNFEDITSIWYRRPIRAVPDSEILDPETQNFIIEESSAFLEGLWKTLKCFWVSNPDSIRIAENKMFQLQVASDVGFITWPTLITNDPISARNFCTDFQFDVVYKTLKKGKLLRGDEQSFIFTNRVGNDKADKFDNIKLAPTLLQKYIHKNKELRITVVGNKVFTIEIDSQSTQSAIHDWRRVMNGNLPHKIFNLPVEVERKCVQLVRNLGLQFGAIDLILTPDNEFVFVEINPNGQWAWIQQLLPDILIRESLINLLLNQE